MSDKVTFKIVYRVDSGAECHYVASDEYETCAEAMRAAYDAGSLFAKVFPVHRVSGVLEALNRKVDAVLMEEAFRKIVEVGVTTGNADDFSAEVTGVLALLGKTVR